jgi:hypothetical protein
MIHNLSSNTYGPFSYAVTLHFSRRGHDEDVHTKLAMQKHEPLEKNAMASMLDMLIRTGGLNGFIMGPLRAFNVATMTQNGPQLEQCCLTAYTPIGWQ